MKKSRTKKLVAALLGTAIAAAGCGVIAACEPETDKEKTYALDMTGVYAYAQEIGYTGTYEELVSLVKGEKGDKGDNGISVKSVSIDEEGHLVFTLSDGSSAKTEKTVKDGASVTGAEIDGEGYIVFTLSDGSTVKSDKAIKDGKDGQNGNDGASVESVAVDNDGYIVFTLTNGNTTKTDKTLAEILAMNPKTCTVSYYGYSEGGFAIEDENYQQRSVVINYGAKLSDPLEAYTGKELDKFISDINFAFGADVTKRSETSWYYMNKGGQLIKYDFSQPVLGDLNLYLCEETYKDYTIGYDGFEGAVVYEGNVKYNESNKIDNDNPWHSPVYTYNPSGNYKYGDKLPEISAYKLFTEGEGEEAVKKLSVFIGWQVNGELATDNVIRASGNIKVKPMWKTVDYGYVTEGIGVDNGIVKVKNGDAFVSGQGNDSIYTGEDDVVIISGDDITAIKNNKFFQTTATVGTKVKSIYIIAPNMNKIANAFNDANAAVTSSPNIFKAMPECESVMIVADNFMQQSNLFQNCPKLKNVILDYTMTKDVNNTPDYQLKGSTFEGCNALETVYLKTKVTTFGSREFSKCYTFDVVKNFGWDFLNDLTAIGYNCFESNETFEEFIIDGDHFKGIAMGTTLNQWFSSTANSSSNRNYQAFKSVKIEMYGKFSFSLSFANLSTQLESVELYLPNATSVTVNTQNCPVKNINVYAPKATTLSGNLAKSNVETLYVTSDRSFKGNADALFIVGNLTATGAFNECTSLKSAEFDVPTINTVSGSLFYGSGNLTHVEFISGDIYCFGSMAFYNCTKLRAVILPDLAENDTRMYCSGGSWKNGEFVASNYAGIHYVFGNCRNLEYLSNYDRFGEMLAVVDVSGGSSFPKSAKVFTGDATNGFYFCGDTVFLYDVNAIPANGEVVIPAKAKAIAQKAFSGMPIKKISFAANSNLERLGDSAFADCKELTTVDMSKATKLVSGETGYKYLFSNCTQLSSVILSTSEKFTTIGTYTFNNCPALTSLEIPANVTAILDNAFDNGSNMQNLTFAGEGAQLTTVGMYLFARAKNIKVNDIFAAICAATVKPDGEGAEFVTPGYLFYECKQITSVEVPAAYTTMGQRLFDGCTNLTNVTFAQGTQMKYFTYASGSTRYDSNAFYGCTSLTSFTVPASAVESPSLSLASLESIVFENGCPNLKEIGSLSGTKITSLTVPASVVTVGALSNCKFLETVTFTDGGVNIRKLGSFQNCEKLKSITIPAQFGISEDGETVGKEWLPLFSGCKALESVIFTDGCPNLTTFTGSTFQNCTSLKEFTVPAGITTFKGGTFDGCENLETVIFASNENLKTGNSYLFRNCKKLTKVTVMVDGEEIGYNTLPKNFTISSSLFQNCSALKEFTFQKPDEGYITMPGSAFANCTELAYLSVPSDTNYWQSNSFTSCTKLKTIVITAGNCTEVVNGFTTKEVDKTDENGEVVKDENNKPVKVKEITGTAFTTTNFKYTPWYTAAAVGDINIVIASGVTAFGNLSFALTTSAADTAKLPRYHFYFEGTKFAEAGTNNAAYANSKNIYETKGTGWDYDENGVPAPKAAETPETPAE